MRKLTIDGFILRAKKVHGDKYDYSETNYVNGRTKVNILCPLHGVFQQLPKNHLYLKQECPKCAGKGKSNNSRFIENSLNVHGNSYDYSKVNYLNNRSIVKIVCLKHGEFKQTPTRHLSGDGCPLCNGGVLSNKEDFSVKAILLYGNKYNYSLVTYRNSSTKVKIICSEHGVFEMRPNNHLSGQECPKCKNKSLGERRIAEWLDKNLIEFETQKTFNECRNKRLLSFDFFIPNNNLLIEFDGKQHYAPIDYFGGLDTLNYIQLNDKIKTNFVKYNNMKLLRIRYDEINRISEILKNNLIFKTT